MTMLKTVSVKLPVQDLRRIPAENRSAFIRHAVQEKLARQEKPWKPKTQFGRELVELQKRYKGKLLTADEIAAEIRERRGGLA